MGKTRKPLKSEELVIKLHDLLITKFGGLHGIRDNNLLKAALTRPFSGLANGTKFYPTIIDQAGALLEALIEYHPFVDGNKRTALITTTLFLEENGLHWEYSDDDIINFAIQIAKKELTTNQIREWISSRVKQRNR